MPSQGKAGSKPAGRCGDGCRPRNPESLLPMTELGEKALLPAGLRDVLAPEAAHEAAVVERLIGALAGRGYERVIAAKCL